MDHENQDALACLFFFSSLNLPIWLKRYSLQFAVGMDNIPPEMDSLEHMGNMWQANLHIPHAAVFLFLDLEAARKLPPTPWAPCLHPAFLRGCTIIIITVVLVCLLFLQSIKKKKKKFTTPWICLSKVPAPFRSLNLKRCLIWQLEPLNWQCVFPKNTKKGKGKKKWKNPISCDFYAWNRCQKIREYSHSADRSFMQITPD